MSMIVPILACGIICPNNSRLKWYDIARKDHPVPSSIYKLALKFIDEQAILNAVPNENELGFTLLHRCGESFYFLMLCTWRDANELWKTVYYMDSKKMDNFSVFPQEHQHKATFCVWEMAVVTHETAAWTQYLLSTRNQKDEDDYLASLPNAI